MPCVHLSVARITRVAKRAPSLAIRRGRRSGLRGTRPSGRTPAQSVTWNGRLEATPRRGTGGRGPTRPPGRGRRFERTPPPPHARRRGAPPRDDAAGDGAGAP